MERFERQVDPHGVLPVDERTRRATAAMKAYFTWLALRSSRSRMKAAAARRTAVDSICSDPAVTPPRTPAGSGSPLTSR
jgi:hypothetical protein